MSTSDDESSGRRRLRELFTGEPAPFEPSNSDNPHCMVTGPHWREFVSASLRGDYGPLPSSAWVVSRLRAGDTMPVLLGSEIDPGKSCSIGPMVAPLLANLISIVTGDEGLPTRIMGYLNQQTQGFSVPHPNSRRMRLCYHAGFDHGRIAYLLRTLADQAITDHVDPPTIHLLKEPATRFQGFWAIDQVQARKAEVVPLSLIMQFPEQLPNPNSWFIEVGMKDQVQCYAIAADGWLPALSQGDFTYFKDLMLQRMEEKYPQADATTIAEMVDSTLRQDVWDFAYGINQTASKGSTTAWTVGDIMTAMKEIEASKAHTIVLGQVLGLNHGNTADIRFTDGVIQGLDVAGMRPGPLALLLASLFSDAIDARMRSGHKQIILDTDSLPSDGGIGDRMLTVVCDHILRQGRKYGCGLWIVSNFTAHPHLSRLAEQFCANRVIYDSVNSRWEWIDHSIRRPLTTTNHAPMNLIPWSLQ